MQNVNKCLLIKIAGISKTVMYCDGKDGRNHVDAYPSRGRSVDNSSMAAMPVVATLCVLSPYPVNLNLIFQQVSFPNQFSI